MDKMKEKLNLWIAYLNLEYSFGKASLFEELIKRALEINDKKNIYLAVINLYKKDDKHHLIDGIYTILTKIYS